LKQFPFVSLSFRDNESQILCVENYKIEIFILGPNCMQGNMLRVLD